MELKNNTKMSTAEIAEWMGIKSHTFSANKQEKLAEMRESYCDIEEVARGKYLITNVKREVYDKDLKSAKQLVKDNYLAQFTNFAPGKYIGTANGAAYSLKNRFKMKQATETITNYVSAAVTEDFGQRDKAPGPRGSRKRVMAKKSTSNQKCVMLTAQEKSDMGTLIKEYFNSEEMAALIQDYKDGLISREYKENIELARINGLLDASRRYWKGEYYLVLNASMLDEIEGGE